MSEVTQTTCPYCGVGCGVLVTSTADGFAVKGNPDHPSNLGRLCSKGAALAETLSLEGRLLYPSVNGAQVGWQAALDVVAENFSRVIDRHGADAVAFYVSGQLLTEDYYVANKLMKGFIGSANIDTNSRLCMSSAVAGYKRAFGTDTVPCSYEDLERTNLIVITGSNTAWCHPVIYQRIKQAKRANPGLDIVVIDPRHTPGCEIADLHLAIKSGMDGLLFNGLLVYLNDRGEINKLFVENCTEGLEAALEAAYESSPSIEQVADACGLAVAQVEQFYALFARKEKVITLFSQGINQFSSGTDKVNSIINCHLLSGRIGRPGMGPFSLTGQPNAMGGREVGGLANQLAAHMELDNPDHRRLVQQHWQSPAIASKDGYKAVALFDAILDDKIKALWVIGTNPAVSMPNNNRVRQALEKCEFLVVSDCMEHTDTTAYAHVVLPASTWGERDGMVTSSERRLSRQRAFLSAPGEARPDWWMICQVAQIMGFKNEFNYQSPGQIFQEYAALTGKENNGSRDLDISALADMDDKAYDQFLPLQWPVTYNRPTGTERMFEDGRFFTPSGKARLVPVSPRGPANAADAQYPLVLNTGRLRDQWHTMTRTGKSPRLSSHEPEAFLEIHPADATKASIENGQLVRVSSRWGEAVVRGRVTEELRPGMVFMPMHWNDRYAGNARAGALVNPDHDPYSGQPEFKHTPVNIEPYQAVWYGFLLSRRRFDMASQDYWNLSKGYGLWRYEIAGNDMPGNWAEHVRQLLCAHDKDVAWMEYFDSARKHYRAARLVDKQLESCVFIGPDHALPNRDWLMALFDKEMLTEQDKAFLLSGRPGDSTEDAGATVCACFGVGRNTLIKAVQEQGVDSVDGLGEMLQAGTNCGSCIPELKALLQEYNS
ncbi:MAG: molybdopterin-dependent oxidoreductase [Gammaproteobacteria bacterium]|nr:molybdopterin-dependent oxidoreductase [Gammaproteobacteria bacterium]